MNNKQESFLKWADLTLFAICALRVAMAFLTHEPTLGWIVASVCAFKMYLDDTDKTKESA